MPAYPQLRNLTNCGATHQGATLNIHDDDDAHLSAVAAAPRLHDRSCPRSSRSRSSQISNQSQISLNPVAINSIPRAIPRLPHRPNPRPPIFTPAVAASPSVSARDTASASAVPQQNSCVVSAFSPRLTAGSRLPIPQAPSPSHRGPTHAPKLPAPSSQLPQHGKHPAVVSAAANAIMSVRPAGMPPRFSASAAPSHSSSAAQSQFHSCVPE